MEPRVPERWLLCPRKADHAVEAAGKGFLAFKVPLDARYDVVVPEEYRWTPQLLLSRFPGDLGLVLDLTKTTRYYSADLFGETCKVQKIACEGHEQPPELDQVRLFIQVCKNFWARNPDKMIGVHCTHGFNRTGFMIVSYLVEELDVVVEDAITFFARARPPGIYKTEYIQELCKRYEGDTAGLVPVPTPEWSIPGAELVVRLRAALDVLEGLKSADITGGVLAEINSALSRAILGESDRKTLQQARLGGRRSCSPSP